MNVGAIIDRPCTGCEFAETLDENGTIPAGRLRASAITIALEAVAPLAGLTAGEGKRRFLPLFFCCFQAIILTNNSADSVLGGSYETTA